MIEIDAIIVDLPAQAKSASTLAACHKTSWLAVAIEKKVSEVYGLWGVSVEAAVTAATRVAKV